MRTFRLLAGYPTARAFAQTLGIEENRYTRYERAESEPDITLLAQISRLLGIAMSELLEGSAAAGEAARTGGDGMRARRGRPTQPAPGAPGLTDPPAPFAGATPHGAGRVEATARAYLLSLIEQRLAALPQAEIDALIRRLIEHPGGAVSVTAPAEPPAGRTA